MRRRDAVQKLKKIIQDWDGCMINTKAAREILERIEEEIGMVPPDNGHGRLGEYNRDLGGYDRYPDHSWTPDVKRRRPMSEIAKDIKKNRNRK